MAKKNLIKKIVITAVAVPVVATIGYFGLADYSYAEKADKMRDNTRLSQNTHQEAKRKYMADDKWAKVNDRLVLQEDADHWDDSTSEVDAASFPTSYLPGFQKFKAATYEAAEKYRTENKEQTFARNMAWKEAQNLCNLVTAVDGADPESAIASLRHVHVSSDGWNHNLPLYAEYCGKNAAEFEAVIAKSKNMDRLMAEEFKRVEREAKQAGLPAKEYVEQQAAKSGVSVEQYMKQRTPGLQNR